MLKRFLPLKSHHWWNCSSLFSLKAEHTCLLGVCLCVCVFTHPVTNSYQLGLSLSGVKVQLWLPDKIYTPFKVCKPIEYIPVLMNNMNRDRHVFCPATWGGRLRNISPSPCTSNDQLGKINLRKTSLFSGFIAMHNIQHNITSQKIEHFWPYWWYERQFISLFNNNIYAWNYIV